MHSYRFRYIFLGLFIYVQGAYSHACGSEFDDVASKSYLANIVFEGDFLGKYENDLQERFNATFKVLKLHKGTLPYQNRGNHNRFVIAGDFGPTDVDECVAPLNAKPNETQLIFLYNNSNPAVPIYRISAFPEPATPKAIKAINSAVPCPDGTIIKKRKRCVRQPRVLLASKSNRWNVGRTITLRCKIDGNPVPKVTWYKDNFIVEGDNKRISIKTNRRSSRLRIKRCTGEDEGIYFCKANNVVGQATKDAVVVVQEIITHYKLVRGDVGAFPPHGESMYDNYVNKLREIEEMMNKSLEMSKSKPDDNTRVCERQGYCLNGGQCFYLESLGTKFCKCLRGYTGRRCQMKQPLLITDPPVAERRDAQQFDRTMTISCIIIGALVLAAMCIMAYCMAKRKRERFYRKKAERERQKAAANGTYQKVPKEEVSQTQIAMTALKPPLPAVENRPGKSMAIQTDPEMFPLMAKPDSITMNERHSDQLRSAASAGASQSPYGGSGDYPDGHRRGHSRSNSTTGSMHSSGGHDGRRNSADRHHNNGGGGGERRNSDRHGERRGSRSSTDRHHSDRHSDRHGDYHSDRHSDRHHSGSSSSDRRYSADQYGDRDRHGERHNDRNGGSGGGGGGGGERRNSRHSDRHSDRHGGGERDRHSSGGGNSRHSSGGQGYPQHYEGSPPGSMDRLSQYGGSASGSEPSASRSRLPGGGGGSSTSVERLDQQQPNSHHHMGSKQRRTSNPRLVNAVMETGGGGGGGGRDTPASASTGKLHNSPVLGVRTPSAHAIFETMPTHRPRRTESSDPVMGGGGGGGGGGRTGRGGSSKGSKRSLEMGDNNHSDYDNDAASDLEVNMESEVDMHGLEASGDELADRRVAAAAKLLPAHAKASSGGGGGGGADATQMDESETETSESESSSSGGGQEAVLFEKLKHNPPLAAAAASKPKPTTMTTSASGAKRPGGVGGTGGLAWDEFGNSSPTTGYSTSQQYAFNPYAVGGGGGGGDDVIDNKYASASKNPGQNAYQNHRKSRPNHHIQDGHIFQLNDDPDATPV